MAVMFLKGDALSLDVHTKVFTDERCDVWDLLQNHWSEEGIRVLMKQDKP